MADWEDVNAIATFEDAAIQHLRDALRMTTAERWEWLQQAMDFGFATARVRATQGRITLGPQGEVLWSPLHEACWTQEGRLPNEAEIGELLASGGGRPIAEMGAGSNQLSATPP